MSSYSEITQSEEVSDMDGQQSLIIFAAIASDGGCL